MITSRQNALVKRLRALRDKKFRDEQGEFVAEGVKSVAEAAALGKLKLVVATQKGVALLKEKGLERLIPLTAEIFSDDVFKAVSEETSPQGVLAIVEKPCFTANITSEKSVFLDAVGDPANVGAIIRSAAAFGYQNVFIADGADAYSGKAVRASMGGIFRVKVFAGTRAELLKKIGVPLVVADMCGENVISAVNSVPQKHCLVIGNEAHGVSEELKNVASVKVAVPMQNGMESLNAAVSAGIIMYALTYGN